ncbi:zinc finger protein 528 [Phlebotomus argentipes]|uniref:zinc finger protein 528 n=1 Tax=Phlebotomus argentipes TaxID=94469 RepID=UPI0028931A63|nr:zinc finger protein 528 [Phlebotomus argentipes]
MDEEETYQIEWIQSDGDDGEVLDDGDIIQEVPEDDGVDMDPGTLNEDDIIEEVDDDEYIAAMSDHLQHDSAGNLVYMSQDGSSMGNIIEEHVQEAEVEEYTEQQQFDGQVCEEVVIDESGVPDDKMEILIDNNGSVVQDGGQVDEEIVPLPPQDEYTTSRPYPCDFCSRRFRKKANLMNHMVAHQTDRPHVCNLCGARYIRRCDLHNHFKIHAYAPTDHDLGGTEFLAGHNDEEEDDEEQDKKPFVEYSTMSVSPRKKVQQASPRKRTLKVGNNAREMPKYDYVDEDMKLVCDSTQPAQHEEIYPMVEQFPVTDPKKPFVCQHCGVSFAREKALASHARMHGGDSPYECETCGEMFWDPIRLREHQMTHRMDQGSTSEYDVVANDEETESDSGEGEEKFGDFYCDVCGMCFHRHALLKRHARAHVKKELVDNDISRHCCNVCGETFAEALDLLAHAEVHARFQPFKCMLCGETFLDETTIKEHIDTTHADELTIHSCRLCGKVCRDSRSLMKHAWDHSREKTHSCSKCAKTFHNKARLKRHMMSHRNKSVTCDVCGEKFPDGRSLMNHRHSHTNVSGRQFPCRECGKTFGSRSSQQIHIRIHTGERPYGCKYCWKAFADGGTLRKHERIHTGEKPYACSVCPRAFNQRVVLREHIRSHHSAPDSQRGTTITPYYCEVCSEMFALPTELIQHLIQHSDMNTLAKRQPPTGPRKYKRRRKLKPHELERLRAQRSKNSDVDLSEDDPMQSEVGMQERYQASPVVAQGNSAGNRQGGTPARRSRNTFNVDSLEDRQMLRSSEDFETSVAKFDLNKGANTRKRNLVAASLSAAAVAMPGQSRPKMIRTQKTRVAVEDGKRRTRTLITRTAPTDLGSSAGSANQANMTARQKQTRARIKNVNYHYQTDRMMSPATFSDVNEQITQDVMSVKQEPVEMTATATVLEHDGSGLSKRTYNKYSMDIVNDLEAILRSPIKQSPSSGSQREMNQVSPSEPSAKGASAAGSKSRRQLSTPGKKRLQAELTAVSVLPVFSNANLTKRQLALAAKKSAKGTSDKDVLLIAKEEKDNEVITGDIDDTGVMKSNAKEFKCEMCSSMFFTQDDLFTHVAIHI